MERSLKHDFTEDLFLTPTEETQSNAFFLQHGGALRMLLPKDMGTELSVLYRYGLQLMEAENTAAAARLFMVLTVYDAWSFDYWLQLARCCQAEKLWMDAAYAYGRAAQIRIDEPEVPYAAAECYIAAGYIQHAHRALHATLTLCGTLPQWNAIRQQAEAQLRRLGVNQNESEY